MKSVDKWIVYSKRTDVHGPGDGSLSLCYHLVLYRIGDRSPLVYSSLLF